VVNYIRFRFVFKTGYINLETDELIDETAGFEEKKNS
jgi:hypothetical protein